MLLVIPYGCAQTYETGSELQQGRIPQYQAVQGYQARRYEVGPYLKQVHR